jgi:hypothetical protein
VLAPARLAAATLLACATASAATAQDPPALPATSAARAPGETSFLVENVTLVEAWRYFEPHPGGGTEPDYLFVGNRSTLGARYEGSRWGVRGSIQYVRMENLPSGAIGPGLLGNGGAYYFQAADTFSYQFYLRGLSGAFRAPSIGLTVEGGRLSMTPEPAAAPLPPAEALARERFDGRLLGDMEGALYERAWDGVRLGVVRGGWQWTAAALLPTQGTFEESANLPMDRVRVATVDVVAAPGAVAANTRFQAFVTGYRDTREVRARPDNSGESADGVDITIATVGASAAGVYPTARGAWDLTASVAGQAGDWYAQPHRAVSALFEGGYQWTSLRMQPWLRAGAVYASGDGDPLDDRHGTFFPMLPANDRHVRSNTYALMNAVDVWAEVRVEPAARLSLQAALHHVSFADTADRWYAGSGATERRGNYFGFQGRDTGGAGTFGWITEGEATWRPVRWWTLNGYLGHIAGGDAVGALFADRTLLTAALVSTLSF